MLSLIEDAIQAPLTSLRSLEHLAARFCQLWLAALVGDLSKKDGLPLLSLPLALASLLSLGLFQLLLDRRGARKLFRVDRVGNLTPELQGLVRKLLLKGRQYFGCNIQRRNIDNGDLLLGRMRVLVDRQQTPSPARDMVHVDL